MAKQLHLVHVIRMFMDEPIVCGKIKLSQTSLQHISKCSVYHHQQCGWWRIMTKQYDVASYKYIRFMLYKLFILDLSPSGKSYNGSELSATHNINLIPCSDGHVVVGSQTKSKSI